MTDTDMKYIRLYLEKTYGLTSEKKIADAADLAADANSYHPIRDYLNGLVWDGERAYPLLPAALSGSRYGPTTLPIADTRSRVAIHRAFCSGCKFEVMLCLVGGQGAGKSTFFRLLAVKDEWFSDDLRKLDDDNVYRKLQGHWIIEMSEMIATANAKSIEEIKSFLSRQKEVYKIPTKPTRRTGCGSACSAGLPTPWTSCPLTVPGTGVSCRSWSTPNGPRYTFWTMKPLPEPISNRYGRKP